MPSVAAPRQRKLLQCGVSRRSPSSTHAKKDGRRRHGADLRSGSTGVAHLFAVAQWYGHHGGTGAEAVKVSAAAGCSLLLRRIARRPRWLPSCRRAVELPCVSDIAELETSVNNFATASVRRSVPTPQLIVCRVAYTKQRCLSTVFCSNHLRDRTGVPSTLSLQDNCAYRE